MKLMLSSLLVICLLVGGGLSNLDDMLHGGEVVEMVCRCAPKHLCNEDGMIIKDGDGLIDPRIPKKYNDMDCSNDTEFKGQNPVTCCHGDVEVPSGTTILPSITPDAQSAARCYYISSILLGGAIMIYTVMEIVY